MSDIERERDALLVEVKNQQENCNILRNEICRLKELNHNLVGRLMK